MTDTSTRAIDGRYYTDPDVFERELDGIFATTWQMVGHVSQLANAGDLITATIGRERVLVTNDGERIHGFYNVCQHRGHELVADGTTHLPLILCPYHAWTYDLAGNLTRARRIAADELGGICVPRVNVDELAGFVFLNLDLDAMPLAEYAPGIEDRLLELAPDARERRLTARLTHTFEANWKIAIENYNECYHCPNVHQAFTSGVVDPTTFVITPSGHNVVHSAKAVTAEDATYELAGESADYGSFFTWPVSSIQCYPGRVLNTFRWVPLAVDRTLLIREWWFDTDEPTVAQQEVIDLDWNTTVAEDFGLMESVHRNMSSRGYRPGPLMVDPSGTADVQHENAVPHLQHLALRALGEP
ncbi:MAG: aromatic ring-hydroxylating dioxygenase subunit alpha [Ilumatobacter sp.]|uniref:aromatic ring-hydroxylating oxygenase subunit alpha n=1 Tax=Ilumatobacter sp. TaxID=1967498 RepID=UPI00261E263E|nr:aromatic ring-hydroxylating dioxygenase subunit alpha [Ilumatobacter sp.]MDJ0770427.1 aromatic ring-hydroxylating dioxygenase subunit alpha [Ilumatobacter sp.]